jgi:hypothetical protein
MMDLPRIPLKVEDTTPSAAWAVSGSPEFLFVFRCKCGSWMLTDQRWTVAPDGTVTPSMLHRECGFHEFVRLADYKAGEA